MESYSDENVGDRKRLNDISKEMFKQSRNPNLRFRVNASVPSEGEVALSPRHEEQENEPSKEDKRLTPSKFEDPVNCMYYGYCLDLSDVPSCCPDLSDAPICSSLRYAFEAPSPTLSEGRVERGFLDTYERRAMAVIFCVLESISFTLDVYGKNKWSFLLAAFILSAFGCGMTIYTSILKKPNAATRELPSQIGVLEIVFSVVQLIVTFIYFILAVLGVQNNFNGSVFPLVFAIILVVFAFQKNPEDQHIDNNAVNSEPAVEISNDIERIVPPNTIDSLVSVFIENDNPSRSHNIGSGSFFDTRRAMAYPQVNHHQLQGSEDQIPGLNMETSNGSQEMDTTSEVAAALENKDALNIPPRSDDSPVESYVGSNGSQVSSMAVGSSMENRTRPLEGNMA